MAVSSIVPDSGFSIVDDGEMLEQINKVMREVSRDLKTTSRGVKLSDIARVGDSRGTTNAEILTYQADKKRDVRSINRRDAAKIAEAFAREIEKRLTAALVKGRTPSIAGMSAGAWREAMRAYMTRALEKIDSQRQSSGAPFGRLTESYAEWKRNKYGFAIPILKATGQLVENLNPRTATGYITLVK
jgi:hypothetical protein